MKYLAIFFAVLLIVGCASQRQKPVCAEIEYRLNHSAMSPDQREWTREELRQCREEQAEYEKTDTLTNKIKKSIYEMYADSKKDSAKTDADTANVSPKTQPVADSSNVDRVTPVAADTANVQSEQSADTTATEMP